MRLRANPLFVSATSWIVITPNVFNKLRNEDKSYSTSYSSTSTHNKGVRLDKSGVSSSLLGVDNQSVMYGNNW